MRYGTFSWFGYEMHHEQRFSLIRQAGFDAVCLWWGNEYRDVDGDKQTLPDMARAHGLAVDNVHATFAQANTLWTASGEDSAAYRTYRDAIEDCARHGIPAVVLHFSQGDACPPSNEIGLDNVRRLTELAERLGVVAALENLRSPAHLEYLFSHIDSPSLGFCYDSGHENCYTHGSDFLRLYGHRLAALHLHDNDGTDDQHRLPGDGGVDWARVRARLAAAHYSGTRTLEVTNEFSPARQGLTAEEFLRLAYDRVSGLFG